MCIEINLCVLYCKTGLACCSVDMPDDCLLKLIWWQLFFEKSVKHYCKTLMDLLIVNFNFRTYFVHSNRLLNQMIMLQMADQEQSDFNVTLSGAPACLNYDKSLVDNCLFCFVDIHHKLHKSHIASGLPSFASLSFDQLKTQCCKPMN